VRAVLLVHGLVALALLGASIHHTAACLPWLWGAPGRPKLASIHAVVVPTLALVAFVLGLWLYPTYKTEVRFAALEVPRSAGGLGMAWLARLFDLKEHLVALLLPAAVGGGVLSQVLGATGMRERRGLVVGLSAFVTTSIAVAVGVGLYVVMVRAVS